MFPQKVFNDLKRRIIESFPVLGKALKFLEMRRLQSQQIVLENCKSLDVKYSLEKSILHDYLNFSAAFWPRSYF